MSLDPNRQPHSLLGEIPLWIAVVMVVLFVVIVKLIYNPWGGW